MKNVCFLVLFLSACSSVQVPDDGRVPLDAETTDVDGGPNPLDSGEIFVDAGSDANSASTECVGLPTDGSRRLYIPTTNNCDGPLSLTVDMEIGSTLACMHFTGTLEVVCDGLNTHWPFNERFIRQGTTYTTAPQMFSCEGVLYTCTLTKDALGNTIALDCDYGLATCTVLFTES